MVLLVFIFTSVIKLWIIYFIIIINSGMCFKTEKHIYGFRILFRDQIRVMSKLKMHLLNIRLLKCKL